VFTGAYTFPLGSTSFPLLSHMINMPWFLQSFWDIALGNDPIGLYINDLHGIQSSVLPFIDSNLNRVHSDLWLKYSNQKKLLARNFIASKTFDLLRTSKVKCVLFVCLLNSFLISKSICLLPHSTKSIPLQQQNGCRFSDALVACRVRKAIGFLKLSCC